VSENDKILIENLTKREKMGYMRKFFYTNFHPKNGLGVDFVACQCKLIRRGRLVTNIAALRVTNQLTREYLILS